MPAPGSILIVDDDPGVIESLCAALSPPHDVRTARTGMDALRIVQQEALDLVLLDYLLPDISGLTVLRALKQAYPSLLVVLMTGFGSEAVAVEAMRGGVRDYLTKPIRVSDLKARVENLLAARQQTASQGSHVAWRIDPVAASPESEPHDANLRRTIAFMEAHLDGPLSLERVAREAGMSKFHFCRHFKDATGLPFREFLVRRRVARALGLLLDRNRSVSQVYQEVGFKDLGHFSRVFRKLTGQPPSRYRRLGGDRAGGGEGAGHPDLLDPCATPASPEAPLSSPTGKKSNRRQIISNRRQAGAKRWG